MKAQNRILDRMIARGATAVVATIADFVDLGNGLVKVIATFSREGTKTEMRQALTAAVEGMGQAVENSFVSIPALQTAAIGFMLANPEVMPFNSPQVAGMRSVTANVLMDDEDRVWSVRDTAAGKCLVRTSSDDLNAVVASARVRTLGVPVLASLSAIHAQPHEFLTYATTDGLQRGFVLSTIDGDITVVKQDGQEDVLAESQIVDVRTFDPEVLEEVTAAAVPTTTDKAAMKEYYTKVFGYNPEYLAEFLALIDENKAL